MCRACQALCLTHNLIQEITESPEEVTSISNRNSTQGNPLTYARADKERYKNLCAHAHTHTRLY